MATKKSISNSQCQAHEICFGLNRETDEKSLATFLKKFTSDPMLTTLIPRLTDAEINATLDFLSKLMHKHLHKKEYHNIFLSEKELSDILLR